jgi:hypothetical protein
MAVLAETAAAISVLQLTRQIASRQLWQRPTSWTGPRAFSTGMHQHVLAR